MQSLEMSSVGILFRKAPERMHRHDRPAGRTESGSHR
jgi:hypothetical protein